MAAVHVLCDFFQELVFTAVLYCEGKTVEHGPSYTFVLSSTQKIKMSLLKIRIWSSLAKDRIKIR